MTIFTAGESGKGTLGLGSSYPARIRTWTKRTKTRPAGTSCPSSPTTYAAAVRRLALALHRPAGLPLVGPLCPFQRAECPFPVLNVSLLFFCSLTRTLALEEVHRAERRTDSNVRVTSASISRRVGTDFGPATRIPRPPLFEHGRPWLAGQREE
jgi:hypothetical protein